MQLLPLSELEAKLAADFPLEQELNKASLIRWVREALQLIGEYYQFENKQLKIKVEDYGAMLPADFYAMDTNYFNPAHRIQGDMIYVGAKEGYVNIGYQAMPTDEKGEILIPANVVYHEALAWYVASKLCLLDQLHGEMFTFEKTNEKWLQKKGEARGDIRLQHTAQTIGNTADNYHSLTFPNRAPRNGHFPRKPRFRR